MKVSARVKIAMQYFEIFGVPNTPSPGCAPVREQGLLSIKRTVAGFNRLPRLK